MHLFLVFLIALPENGEMHGLSVVFPSKRMEVVRKPTAIGDTFINHSYTMNTQYKQKHIYNIYNHCGFGQPI
jgi:hypothetical protein